MKPVKALILGLLLLVPILIFIFISVFGTHHFSLRTFYPKLDERGDVVYNAAGDTVFLPVPFFELTTEDGSSLSQSDLDSSLYIANFFQASCQGTCPEVFSQLSRVQEAFANNPQVKLVSMSTTPLGDSLQVLQRLADRYHMIDGKWHLLTGDSAEVSNLLQKGFHQELVQDESSVTAGDKLLLVDKEKMIRGVYDGADKKEVDRLILEINVLLDEYSKRK